MFVGIHALAAMQTNTPELAITNEEGSAFLKAAQDVARHYSVETTQKTLDWIAFAGVVVSMYGTRAFAIGARRRAERATRIGPGNVVPLHPVDPGSHQAGPPPGPANGSPMPEYVPEHFEEE